MIRQSEGIRSEKWNQLPEKWKFVRGVSRWEMVGLIQGTEKQQFGSMLLWPEGEFVIAGKAIYLNLAGNYYEVAIRNERKLGWVKQDALKPGANPNVWDEHPPQFGMGAQPPKKLFDAFEGCDHTVLISAIPPERTKTQEIPVIDLATLRPGCNFCKKMPDGSHEDACPESRA